MLERAVRTGPEFAKLFGITTVRKASSNAADYPYILSEVAEKIWGKGSYWYKAQVYLDRIKSEKGVDIKASDNGYHSTTKTGRKTTSVAHKYSPDFVDLIQRMMKGEEYELDI
jgi:hypothetical protein